jgi:hypothetical protein
LRRQSTEAQTQIPLLYALTVAMAAMVILPAETRVAVAGDLVEVAVL